MTRTLILVCLTSAILISCGQTAPENVQPDAREMVGTTTRSSDSESSAIDEEMRDQLEAIGYLAGYTEQAADTGTTFHDANTVYPGYNLFASGHAPAAYLASMTGDILHTWTYDSSPHYPVRAARDYWRRIHLADNGDLYALVDPHGIVKLNSASELIWHTDGGDLLHHDLFVADDGTIHAIGKKIAPIADLHPTRKMIDDTVVIFDSQGDRLHAISIFESFRGTEWFDGIAAKIDSLITFYADKPDLAVEIFHTNTIEVLDGSLEHISPFLKKGNVVLCSPLHQNVFIMDTTTGKIVWNWHGPWQRGIHQPTFLPNGNWLLFDNAMYFNSPKDAASQVLEYTFPAKKQVWVYEGDPGTGAFYSRFSSLADRLPNGNTLITVSNEGRAIEVTPDRKVAWEYRNPYHVSDDMRGLKGFDSRADGKIVGTLFQLERVAPSTHDEWLKAAP